MRIVGDQLLTTPTHFCLPSQLIPYLQPYRLPLLSVPSSFRFTVNAKKTFGDSIISTLVTYGVLILSRFIMNDVTLLDILLTVKLV